MESDIRHLRISGICQPDLCKLAVSRIYVVHLHVVHRRSNHSALRNLRRKEHDVRAEEFLHIVHAKSGLNRDLCAAEIAVHIQRVDEHSNSCRSFMHLLKFILYPSHGHRNRHLECTFLRCERTGQQGVVHVSKDHVDQLLFKFFIRHSYGRFHAVFNNCFQCQRFRILPYADRVIGYRSNGELRKRDLFSLRYLSAFQRSCDFFSYQLSAVRFPDRLCDSKHLCQRGKVVSERCDEINLSRVYGDLLCGNCIRFCCEKLKPSRKFLNSVHIMSPLLSYK